MRHDHHHHDGDEIHDHDRGLAHDLKIMAAMMERRRALRLFAGVGGAALVASCGGSDESSATSVTASSSGTTATPTPTASVTAMPTPTSTATGTTTVSQCIADPAETAGPYPADGTNTSSGSTSNVLTSSGVVRSDIRKSFLTTTTDAGGTLVTLTITVVNVNASCAPLAGYAVYLWMADRQGHYSLYSGAAGESYLRGVQVTDANGQVTFTTYYPACYDGRWPHMHFEVYSSLSAATSGRYAVLTSQFALPAAINSVVFAQTSLYPSSASNYARVSLGGDGVFGDNTSAQLGAMTPTFTGDISNGYTATAVIGIAR